MQDPGRRRRRGGGPGRFTGSTASAAASLLALWTTTNQFRAGLSSSSGNSCQFESIICLADADCSACIDTLQAILTSTELSVGTSSGACEGLFADLCGIVDEAGCDATNEELVDLASCVAEDSFGCPGFTSCADAVVLIDATATPAPAGALDTNSTMEPSPSSSSVEPTAAASDTNSTMQPSSSSTLEAPSPAPTAVVAVASTPPDTFAPTAMVEDTASPSSADGSRGLDPVSTPTPSSTPVEAGEEAGTSGGGGGGRRSISTAVATVTGVSIVFAFLLAIS